MAPALLAVCSVKIVNLLRRQASRACRACQACLACLAAAALAAVTAGCTADIYPPTVGGYTTVYATSVPPDMAAYPRAPYADSYAYLVGNRWYYRRGTRWVVLQREPPELYRYRSTYYVRTAPPAYRPAPPPPPSDPRQYAPPAQYGYPPPAIPR